MFDYMDDILALQALVFGSLDMSRSNSMTPCGQCRLAPLIPCVLDASQLYDYCVKMLFKLHGILPADILAGHRDRFSKQFRLLKGFYNTMIHMQYFKHLITIPSLPENPPNFLIQSELGTYVTPVVVLPPEDTIYTETVSDSLIDTSDTNSIMCDESDTFRNGSNSPDVLAERNNLIEHLNEENAHQRKRLNALVMEHENIVTEFRNRILELENALSIRGSEIIQEKQKSADCVKQKDQATGKLNELESKSQIMNEKFQKLKQVYAKLREEHISLIRKKAEDDKHLGGLQIQRDQLKRQVEESEQRMEELVQGQATAEQEAERIVLARAELDQVRKQLDALKTENLALVAKMDFVSSEKSAVEGDLHDLLAQKEELEGKVSDLQSEFERSQAQLKADTQVAFYELLLNCLSETENILQNAMQAIENPAISAVTCTPDYLLSLVAPISASLDKLKNSFGNYVDNPQQTSQLIRTCMYTVYLLSMFLIHAKSTSNTSTDVGFGDRIADECKQMGSQCLVMISYIKEKSSTTSDQIDVVRKQLETISSLVATLTKTQNNVEKIGDLVECELLSMDKAIEEAANRIKDMIDKSRAADSGVKLEVNGKILGSCTELMMAIRKLVQTSRNLQMEIVSQGKGTASTTEFYKRNHQWSEGLISAAKSVGMGANFLLEAADKVVSGSGKFEQLMVASQGIAASTAQLVVASRVKAERTSQNLSALSEASRGVTQATGTVVATAKSCSALIEENDDFNMKMSLHQAKRLEMESKVRVMELEQALETERLKLSALRRYHYQLADENNV